MARIRVVIKIPSDDAYELKAQALNNDPRLKAAGISALKFEDDKQYIADGEFSDEPPPPSAPAPGPAESEAGPVIGERLRVVVRLVNDDAYELKAQALNDDPRLKAAGISALKFEGEKQYIADGEFVDEPPSPQAIPSPVPGEKLRVVMRMLPDDAYDLISRARNEDPKLAAAGILAVNLVKSGGVAASGQSRPAPKRRGPLTRILVGGIIIGAILLIAGVVFGAPALFAPVAPTPSLTATIVSTNTPVPTDTPVPVTPSRTATAISTKTNRPVPTATDTPTAVPVSCVAPQEATIKQQLNCRWGPGGVYIYRDGAYPGEQAQIIGRSDTAYGTWIYIQLPRPGITPSVQCWINSDPKFSDYQGDVACLEDYYPGKARELRFSHPNFPPPSDVSAVRAGDQVNIYWTGQSLAPGDRPDEGKPPFAPVYLVETWTCQAGKIVFTPQGVYTDDMSGTGTFDASASVIDEAGCSEPSHGRVFLAHKDGYVGPVEISWPVHP